MTYPDPNQWLTGSGIPSATFHNIGDSISGTVLDLQTRQQRDIATGEPLVWKNGDPRLQVVITLQTSLRDREIEDDDGRRNLYVASPKMRDAISQAVRTSGGGVEKGGRLTVRFVGEGEPTTRGFNPPKLYAAEYVGPDAAEASDILSTGPQAFQNAAAYSGPVPPVAETAPPKESSDGTPPWRVSQTQSAALIQAGIDVGEFEQKRKALFDLGLDMNIVKP